MKKVRGTGFEFTPKEIEYLKLHYQEEDSHKIARQLRRPVRSIYQKALSLGLKKSKDYIRRTCHILENGKNTRFKKNHVPANKGTKGLMKANRTSFVKGNLPGNTKHDGFITKRIYHQKNGDVRYYYWIRIAQGKWIPYHRKLWEDVHGPIPPGHIVVFKDKNSLNCVFENLELITLQQNANRNHAHQYDLETARTIFVLNKLKKTIRDVQHKNNPKRSANKHVSHD